MAEHTYQLQITLRAARHEDLPDNRTMQRLVMDQLSGELDEATELLCTGVYVVGLEAEADRQAEMAAAIDAEVAREEADEPASE